MRFPIAIAVGLLLAGSLRAAAPDTLFVEVDAGVELEVLDWGGDGPAVLLLAGLGNTAHVFEDFAPRLARHARVRGVTRRGYGASTRAHDGYDQETLARDLARVCDALNVAHPVLVGHSLAGSEMAWFETLWPGRARALVFLDAAYDHSRLGELDDMAPHPAARPPSQADKSSLEAVRAWLLREKGFPAPPGEIAALFRFAADGRLVDARGSGTATGFIRHALPPPPYGNVRAPTLALYAKPTLAARYPLFADFALEDLARARRRMEIERDWMSTQAATFQQLVPHATVVIRDGANHFLFLTDGAGTAMAVGAFLGGLAD